MSNYAVKVENLYKKYRLGKREPYYSLRDAIMGVFKKPVIPKQNFLHGQLDKDEFWALKNVSFEIQPGDVIGIIGKNGAGKTTLLKLLSRITPPTRGKIMINGRVASLLEVGTGFHPELTGRENIYLNGSILGMKRREISKKFSEIVDFAEVSKFLDMPVKHYSSGMYTRLAFAVAAHLPAEILLIDEVLAVGDSYFQKKSLGKMGDISREGRTVFLVSHNLYAVKSLATKALLFDSGETTGVETVGNAMQAYLGEKGKYMGAFFKSKKITQEKEAYIIEARLLDKNEKGSSYYKVSEPVILEMTWQNVRGVDINTAFMLTNQNGINVLLSMDANTDWFGTKKRNPGIYQSRVVIPANFLNKGNYTVSLSLDKSKPKYCFDNQVGVLQFEVWDPMDKKSIARGAFKHERSDVALWSAFDWQWKKIHEN